MMKAPFGETFHVAHEMEHTLVMCCMERTHDSDPTPTIVSSIPTPAKWNH